MASRMNAHRQPGRGDGGRDSHHDKNEPVLFYIKFDQSMHIDLWVLIAKEGVLHYPRLPISYTSSLHQAIRL